MRLISQDGYTDIPYDRYAIKVFVDEETDSYQIGACGRDPSNPEYILASYKDARDIKQALNAMWTRNSVGGAQYKFP